MNGLPLDEVPLSPRPRIEEAPLPQRAWRMAHDIEALDDLQRRRILRAYWGKQRTLLEHPESLVRAHMVRTERCKLICRLRGEHELYDLERDPQELVNLYGRSEYDDVARRLESRLLQFFIEHQQDQPQIEELWA